MQKIIVTLFALCLASCSWGKNSTEIDNQNSVAPGSFCYQDNKIYYYTDSNKEDNLYDLKCYNIKTNEKQIIKQLSMTNKFDVIGNEIYYLNYLEKDETPGVYKCDINSPKDSEKKIYSFDSEEWVFMKAYSEYFAVYDGYIYQNRYTMSCTPEDQEQNILLQNINSMNIWQDKIYYNPIEQVGLSCTLHVMNQDGSNDKILVHNEDISRIECNNAWTDTLTKYGGGISNIVTYQDKLYFIAENYQKLGYLYCCNTNGKDLKNKIRQR